MHGFRPAPALEEPQHELLVDRAVLDEEQATGPLHICRRDAGKCLGLSVTVEGRIAAAHNPGRSCLLSFHWVYHRDLAAVISAFSPFPVSRERPSRAKPEVMPEHPDQIEIRPVAGRGPRGPALDAGSAA